jgi:hypothetical protein
MNGAVVLNCLLLLLFFGQLPEKLAAERIAGGGRALNNPA